MTRTSVLATSALARPRRSRLAICALEAWYEFVKTLRLPAYTIPTLSFPAMFYVIFGLGLGVSRPVGETDAATYFVATYGTFGVMGAALFGFGVGVAIERGQGWLLLKRATPMPVTAYFFAKVVMTLLFGTAIVLMLSMLGVVAGGVRLSLGSWLALGSATVFGAMPSCALGLAIGYLAGPNSAVPLVNLIYLPVAFASGLWLPIQFLPTWLQEAAVILPPYHHSQLALAAIGADRGGPIWGHVLVLVGSTGVFLGAAYLAYLRDEGKTYG
ncbi:MAG: ABC transporter permease [Luteitalea sp.]|nr:ABC transporter permease [Luteitalea sp.]